MPEIVVGESTVREYVCERRQAMGLLKHQVFIAQSYHFGDEAQVDCTRSSRVRWPAAQVYIFCMRSMASGALSPAYPHATQQAFLEATSWVSLVWWGFHTLRFDNLTSR